MTKVITYGTYDLLHHGHIRLLERAKALGDYLIVGVTSDDFDRTRGKINVQQTLEERVEAVRQTGIADKIIIEEYEGQKIDDIRKYGVDIFTVGSDWKGYFDYLGDYCDIVYLSRTEGISSSEIRSCSEVKVGLVGYAPYLNRVLHESSFVDGAKVTSLYSQDVSLLGPELVGLRNSAESYEEFLKTVDAVFIHSNPGLHYEEVKKALLAGKHVMCESPIAESGQKAEELLGIAQKHGLVLMDSLRTAYSMAYQRMLLLVKGGRIGDVVSVDATCTSLKTNAGFKDPSLRWGSMETWGPTALLPVFQLLGTEYDDASIVSLFQEDQEAHDEFSEVVIRYPNAVATCKVGTGVKSEGSLVISGTKGYIYVPAPWWKTEYFEVRFEDPSINRRYFYQLDGEGIRYEWVAFLKLISSVSNNSAGDNAHPNYFGEISADITLATCEMMDRFMHNKTIIHAK